MKKVFVPIVLLLFQLKALDLFAQKNHYYSVEKTVAPGQKAYTLYNQKGVQIIPHQHDWISVNNWKWIFVFDHHTAIVYDSLGKSLGIEGIEEIHHVWLTSDLIPLRKKGLWGYYTKKGTLKIPHLYQQAALFDHGQAAVQLDGKYCYIDASGNVLDKTFTGSPDEIFMILETALGLSLFSNYPQELVHENGKFGLRDKRSGKMLIKCAYDGLYNITDQAVIAEKDGRYGVINFKGKIILPIEHEMIYLLDE